MKIFKTWGTDLDEKQLHQITEALRQGEIMVYPTDTLYAVGCDALNVKAVDKLCRLKGINPQKTSLSIICADISMASQYARWDNWVFNLLKHYTPGPYTFLLKVSSALPRVFRGRKIVGVRIPDFTLDRQIVQELGNPLLTTSVEFDDTDYVINPDLLVEAYADKVDFLIDAGIGGDEGSTVIDCSGDAPELIRAGKGDFEE